MFKLMGKEINATLGAQTVFIWTYDLTYNSLICHNLFDVTIKERHNNRLAIWWYLLPSTIRKQNLSRTIAVNSLNLQGNGCWSILILFVWFWFFTSHQQSFSYKGMGLPGLNQYYARINVLAQGHNTVTPVRVKPAAHWSRVKHSTTEPLHSCVGLYCLQYEGI